MKKFGNNDTVFARVTMMGHEILNVRIDGVGSIDAIIRRIKEELKSCFGIITLNIRNLTQGWAQSKAYRIA